MGWGITRVLTRLVRRRQRYCECRRCGTAVDDPAAGCPHCESASVVEYEL